MEQDSVLFGGTLVLCALLASVFVVFLAVRCFRRLRRPRRHLGLKYTEVPASVPTIKISVPSSSSAMSITRKSCLNGAHRMRLFSSDAVAPPWMSGENLRMPLSTVRNNKKSPNSSPGVSPTFGLEGAENGEGADRRSSSAKNSVYVFNADEVFVEEGQSKSDDADDHVVLRYELGFYEKTGNDCYRGTLTFALRYDFIHRVLMLHVLRANHLPVERNSDKEQSADPYVKVYLLPDRRNHCKTRIARKTLDPEFNEMFSFDVSFNSLSNKMLQFTVYDFDRFTRHGLIGNVIMRDLFDKSDLYTWTEYTMNIVCSQEKNDFGDLLLYLSYSPQDGKLFVTVAKAYNLRPMDITGASDPYVKVEQIFRGRRVKMRKTTIKRANLNPVYHETLEFDVPNAQVGDTNMLVQVMDWDRIGKDDLLGCCILGPGSPTPQGRTQWDSVFASAFSKDSPPPQPGQRTKPFGTWHSILSEVPEDFRDMPKARK